MTRRARAAVALCCAAALLAGCGVFGADGDGDGGSGGDGAKPHGRPPAGKATKNASPKDFNGDGYDDYVTALSTRLDGKSNGPTTQTLSVVYGSEEGLRPEWSQRVRSGGKGGAFSPPRRTDLDGDGFTDLVASRTDGTSGATERPFVMFGGARGLSDPRPLGIGPYRPLAAGDFDGDGATDLFDGSETLHGPFDRDERKPARTEAVGEANSHPVGTWTGDFDGDRRTDVVMTNEYHGDDYEQNDDPPESTPQAVFFRGGPQGLVRETDPGDALAASMSTYDGPLGGGVGDTDGDGIDDYVATGEVSLHSVNKLTFHHGSADGLDGGRAPRILEGRGSTWGTAPMIGDVNGDRRPDVVMERPGFHIIGPDRIILLPGGSEGPSDEGEQTVMGGDSGLPEGPARHEFESLQMLDVDGDQHQDVVVYAENSRKKKGYFLVLRGTEDGLDATDVPHFTDRELGLRAWER